MGAKFEIAIISEDFIPFQTSMQYLQELGLGFSPWKLQCIQDWSWSDQHDLDLEAQAVKPLLDAGRIVLLYGTLAGIDAGIFTHRNEDGTYQTDLWFDERLYQFLNIRAPLGCKAFYEKLEMQMESKLMLFAPYNMILVVMGEEIVFEYFPDLEKTRNHCRVDRWIEGQGADVIIPAE